jgi:hypothetical protein
MNQKDFSEITEFFRPLADKILDEMSPEDRQELQRIIENWIDAGFPMEHKT